MKRHTSFLSMIVAASMCALSVVSCGEPEEKIIDNNPDPEPPVSQKVPEGGSFEVVEGMTVTILFDSYADWTAASDVSWIKLSAEAGEAGENTLECEVGSEERNFNEASNGKVTITVEGKGYDYTFTRAASERVFSILDRNGQAIGKIDFDEAADESLVQQFTVEANFHWDLDVRSNWPLWIMNPGITEGEENDEGLFRNTVSIAINEAQLDGTDKSGEITFTDLYDESFAVSIPVSFKAKPVVEVPFSLTTELGINTIHISPDATFKDKDGNRTTKMYMLSVTLETLPDEEVVILSTNGRKYNEECSCLHEPVNTFLSLVSPAQSTDGELMKTEYSLMAMPGMVYPEPPAGNWYNLGYIFVLPKAVWEPYAQYKENPSMMFIMMNAANEFFNPYYTEGNDMQVSCDDGLVWTLKESMRKYAIKVMIDSE